MTFEKFCEQLEQKIKDTYQSGVTVEDAEKLAAEFLHAMLQVSTRLKQVSLDARMKKSGVKALRAALYLETIKGHDKKPTEGQITATLDSSDLVGGEQNRLDEAEVEKEDLERYFDIFNNAHVFYRQISKASNG